MTKKLRHKTPHNHIQILTQQLNLGEIKNGVFSRKAFERAILFDMGFSCFSHESVSNLLANSKRIIQIDEHSKEQQPY